MDFEKGVDSILKQIPRARRTYLFSATMTKKVAKLQRASLKDPVLPIDHTQQVNPEATFTLSRRPNNSQRRCRQHHRAVVCPTVTIMIRHCLTLGKIPYKCWNLQLVSAALAIRLKLDNCYYFYYHYYYITLN